MRIDLMSARILRSLRPLFFLVATSAGVVAILLAVTAIPDADRNPASPDFGWLRAQWLEGFVVAVLLTGLAIGLAARRVRMLLAVLLLIVGAVGVVPAYQFWAYQVMPDLHRLLIAPAQASRP